MPASRHLLVPAGSTVSVRGAGITASPGAPVGSGPRGLRAPAPCVQEQCDQYPLHDGCVLTVALYSDVKRMTTPMSRSSSKAEVWVGARGAVGDREALAWVRLSDEWLVDAGLAGTEVAIAELARMVRDAVAKRGRAPEALLVRDEATRDALRAELGQDIAVQAGFDQRAQDLSDAAVSAIQVAFGAEAMLSKDARASQAELMHARMHETVEVQLAANDPPAVRRTLERLQRQGLERGAAVHAIAGVFMHLMHRVLETGQPFDPAVYAAALDALSATSGTGLG